MDISIEHSTIYVVNIFLLFYSSNDCHHLLFLFFDSCRADFYVKDRSFRVRGTKTCIYGGAHELGSNIVSFY